MSKLERAIYEWRKPELQGKDWTLMGSATTEPWAHWPGHFQPLSKMSLPPLYINGRPNMDFWHYECVPRLETERVQVWYVPEAGGYWRLCPYGSPNEPVNSDPLIALGEYLGVT